MQLYTIFFITVNTLRVSGGFSVHHQELKNCTHTASGMSQVCLLLPLAWMSSNSSTLAAAASTNITISNKYQRIHTHTLLKHHFINTIYIYQAYMFQPSKGHPQGVESINLYIAAA